MWEEEKNTKIYTENKERPFTQTYASLAWSFPYHRKMLTSPLQIANLPQSPRLHYRACKSKNRMKPYYDPESRPNVLQVLKCQMNHLFLKTNYLMTHLLIIHRFRQTQS